MRMRMIVSPIISILSADMERWRWLVDIVQPQALLAHIRFELPKLLQKVRLPSIALSACKEYFVGSTRTAKVCTEELDAPERIVRALHEYLVEPWDLMTYLGLATGGSEDTMHYESDGVIWCRRMD